jgi:hypothetical protein
MPIGAIAKSPARRTRSGAEIQKSAPTEMAKLAHAIDAGLFDN